MLNIGYVELSFTFSKLIIALLLLPLQEIPTAKIVLKTPPKAEKDEDYEAKLVSGIKLHLQGLAMSRQGAERRFACIYSVSFSSAVRAGLPQYITSVQKEVINKGIEIHNTSMWA